MKSDEALKYLKEKDRETVVLSNIEAVLSWDMETVMPEKAEGERAQQMAYLALRAHDIKKDEKLKEAVYSIDIDSLSVAEKALLREWKREVERASLVPSTLVEEMALETGLAHSKWLEGREKNDWKIFLPSMERLVALNKEYALCIGDGSYDTLLDLYERGMTEKTLDSLFDSLESSIHSIMDKVEGRKVDTSFLR